MGGGMWHGGSIKPVTPFPLLQCVTQSDVGRSSPPSPVSLSKNNCRCRGVPEKSLGRQSFLAVPKCLAEV